MAIEYYQNLTPKEKLGKIGELITKGIYLNEKILTTRETMDFLKISRTTLWRFGKQKELSYCIVGNGRLIRFKLSEILNFLETTFNFYIDTFGDKPQCKSIGDSAP